MNLRIILASLALSLPAAAQTVTTLDANDHFGWAQNAGWINGSPLGAGKDGLQLSVFTLSGTAWAQNIGWLDFGDGEPDDGLRYSNLTATDFGVNVDCDGNLSGYAWAQNAGYISFAWASASDPNRPRVNGGPFDFTGFAWSQNLGWINLGSGFLQNDGAPIPFEDNDGDGLPDSWEIAMTGGTGTFGSTTDTDADGLADAWEFANFAALGVTDGTGDFDQDANTDREEFLASSNPRNNLSIPPPTGSTIAGNVSGSFAWGQNTGWSNFRHDRPQAPSGVTVRESVLIGHAWGANLGWMDFGNGAPANGIRYSNTTNTDYGVNHDGAGNLSGYAWSRNAGWINFGWAAANHTQRPRISLTTGVFTGYAWSQNTGWINLGSVQTTSIQLTDNDGDGLDDAWERERFGNLTTANATSDFDHDGRSDASEYLAGTDPLDGQSYLRILASSINPARTVETLTFTSSPTRVYRVVSSPNLTSWTPSLNGWFSGFDGSTIAGETLPSPQAKYFFRVEAKRPLTP